MEKLLIDLGINSYNIIIGGNLLENVDDHLEDCDQWVLITDENVDRLQGHKLGQFLKKKKVNKIVIPPGEVSKNLHNVENILKQMLELGLTRKSMLLAFGGGVVGDIGGFCASIYMRGIPFIQLPTTLLSQVDSSVGGKTGVNLPQGKNTVGSFYQPKKVLIDILSLKTLPKRELIGGIGEVIKYGIIYDYDFLNYIDKHFTSLLDLEDKILKQIIKRSCEIKAEVVSKDEREEGLRKILNHGHTIGHGLEIVTKYEKYTHGEAVLVGMYYETLMGKHLGNISDDYCNKIFNLIKKTNINLCIEAIKIDDLIDSMARDKKNIDDRISFILPNGKGRVEEILLTKQEVNNIIQQV